MSIQKMFDALDDGVAIHDSFGLDFSIKGFGFGQLYFYEDDEGKLVCANECMGKETIKKILGVMVDRCVLEDDK